MARMLRQKFFFWLTLGGLLLAIGLVAYVFYAKRINGNGQARWPVPTKNISPTVYVLRTTNYVPIAISFVHDGDTIYTRGSKQAIRLIGIDAPELAGSYRCGTGAKCTDTIEECGASAAKEKLKELVLKKEVGLVEDNKTGSSDKYGRALRYVFLCRGGVPPPMGAETAPLQDCSDLSLILIQSGLVRESGFGNAYEKQNTYRQAELEAKENKLGIWKICEENFP